MISITTIVGPLIATQLFGFFGDKTAEFYFPGAPYLSAGIVYFIAMITAIIGLNKLLAIEK